MIELKDIGIKQGDFELSDINFDLPAGQYAVIMGRSGSGKTTLMELVLGLRRPDSGNILLEERDITRLRPAERRIGYVPQDGALFPHMRVGDQIALPLQLQKTPVDELNERVQQLGKELDISDLLTRYPAKLSGGEKQRVALARALAMQPRLLCFDEPLSALDESLHDELCALLRSQVKDRGITALHITHSRREAKLVADRLYHLEEGQLKRYPLDNNGD